MTKREFEMKVEFENSFETSWMRMRGRVDASFDHRLCWTEILHILQKIVEGNRIGGADDEHLGAP